ncbi:hypothetical protein SKAU_G00058920 [Synaphobranchus kaupii]|uniref:Uncharacterized protein n=1 Tax=Synaphobranchus kaupii TaxID=118154 RepID=A0A9Q1G5I8_SYNKA|nr:hypothetical protein SKAU_G00058920 [Synaphobranchus kaupii]
MEARCPGSSGDHGPGTGRWPLSRCSSCSPLAGASPSLLSPNLLSWLSLSSSGLGLEQHAFLKSLWPVQNKPQFGPLLQSAAALLVHTWHCIGAELGSSDRASLWHDHRELTAAHSQTHRDQGHTGERPPTRPFFCRPSGAVQHGLASSQPRIHSGIITEKHL